MTNAVRHEALSLEGAQVLRTIGPACDALGFYLADGTAVALRFGHRRSVDLDWFSGRDDFDVAGIRDAVERTGVGFSVTEVGPGTLHGLVNGVAVSFLRYRYGLLEEPQPLEGYGCHTASLEDLACMKLAAATARGAKKDLLDVAILCRDALPLDRALELFREKYRMEDAGHVVLSLTWFDEAEREPTPSLLDSPTWEEAKAFLTSEVRRLAAP